MNKWVSTGRYHFLKHDGNRFDVIEVIHFGKDFLGAVFSFTIEPAPDMQDYIRIADETDFKFEDDTYKYAWAKARTVQLEESIAVKISDDIQELEDWVNCWKLLSNDYD